MVHIVFSKHQFDLLLPSFQIKWTRPDGISGQNRLFSVIIFNRDNKPIISRQQVQQRCNRPEQTNLENRIVQWNKHLTQITINFIGKNPSPRRGRFRIGDAGQAKGNIVRIDPSMGNFSTKIRKTKLRIAAQIKSVYFFIL